MKVLVTSLGTHGDFSPMRALASGLAALGHSVTLCASAAHLEEGCEAGLDTLVVEDFTRNELVTCMRAVADEPCVARRTQALVQSWMMPAVAAFATTLRSVIGAYGRRATNGLGLAPHVRLGALRSDDLLCLLCPMHAAENDELASYDVHKLSLIPHVLFPEFQKRHADLVTLSDVEPPEAVAAGAALAAARDFAKADDRPTALVTLGSLATFRPEHTLKSLRDAAARARWKLLVQTGWGFAGIIPEGLLADDCLVIGEAPHDPLMALVDGVVHHGGLGTVTATLRAGRPAITLPQVGDQDLTARRLVAEGVSPGWLDPAELDGDACGRLFMALSDAPLRARAAALATHRDLATATAPRLAAAAIGLWRNSTRRAATGTSHDASME